MTGAADAQLARANVPGSANATLGLGMYKRLSHSPRRAKTKYVSGGGLERLEVPRPDAFLI